MNIITANTVRATWVRKCWIASWSLMRLADWYLAQSSFHFPRLYQAAMCEQHGHVNGEDELIGARSTVHNVFSLRAPKTAKRVPSKSKRRCPTNVQALPVAPRHRNGRVRHPVRRDDPGHHREIQVGV